MPVTVEDLAAQDAAAAQQASQQQAAAQAPHPALQGAQQSGSVLDWMRQLPGRVTTSMLDGAVSAAEVMHQHLGGLDTAAERAERAGRDVAAGTVTGATNIADAASDASSYVNTRLAQNMETKDQGEGDTADLARQRGNVARDQQGDVIWNHAKSAILDFRDAVAVKDPNLVDRLTQSVAQLAIPFAGFSRALSVLGDAVGVGKATEEISAAQPFGSYLAATAKKDVGNIIRNVVAPGAATDATALDPHAPRFADMIALARHTEGKMGDVLRTLAPDGSAVNAYVNYLTDRTNETEAEGRFKNVLDGFGVNMLATPLLTAVGSTLKQGVSGLRYLVDNGVSSAGDLPRPPAATQAGKIVFHGTGSDFDEFDPAKIGSGEGNQSFGHGFYFAENPDTAGHYRSALTRNAVPANSPMNSALDAVQVAGGDSRHAYQTLTRMASEATDPALRDRYTTAAGIVRSGNAVQRGRLMHVEIPDEHIVRMLDHDKLMGEQKNVLAKIPKADQGQLEQMLEDHNQDGDLEDFTGGEFRQLIERAINEGYLDQPPVNGVGGNAAEDASQYLRTRGVPGIKYLDQGSRGKSEGSRNIVLFNSRLAKIVKKE